MSCHVMISTEHRTVRFSDYNSPESKSQFTGSKRQRLWMTGRLCTREGWMSLQESFRSQHTAAAAAAATSHRIIDLPQLPMPQPGIGSCL